MLPFNKTDYKILERENKCKTLDRESKKRASDKR